MKMFKMIYVCILIVTSICRTAALGQVAAEELDPASLLAKDCEKSDEKIVSPDIQMPSLAEQEIFNNPVSTVNQAINFAAAIKDQLPQTSPPAADNQKRLELQLRKSNISPPTQHRQEDKTDDLKQIIAQIRSMNLEPKPSAQQPADTAPVIKSQPSAIKAEALPVQTQTPEKPIIDNTLQMVEEMLKDPNRISTPLELAEVLFQSGRIVPAGLCYKQALVSMDVNDPNKAEERAWILFQIGNCLKYEDPNTARNSFSELVRTQPGSSWAEIAKSEHGLVEWYQQDQPRKLIQELNR
jgi:hypothetical protein